MGEEKSAPSAGSSNFTVVLTTPGSPIGPSANYEVITVTTVAATLIVPGDYTLISTPTNTICLYSIVNNIGLAPTSVTADVFVPVRYTSTMSSADVAAAYTAVVNLIFYALPNPQGMFTRVISETSVVGDPEDDGSVYVDPNYNKRSARPDGNFGLVAGSIQIDDIIAHNHSTNAAEIISGSGYKFGEEYNIQGASIGYTGGNETRPTNIYVRKIIKF